MQQRLGLQETGAKRAPVPGQGRGRREGRGGIVIEDRPPNLPQIELTRQQSIQFLRLAFCRTYANLQGVTLRDEHILLLDTRHKHMCRRKLHVAASRVTAGKYLHIPTWSQEEDLAHAFPPTENETE